MTKNQNGFGLIGILAILLLVALIGTIGWLVIGRATNKTAVESTQTKTTPALAIKEWGVKIPLGAADEGAYYAVDKKIEQSASNPINLIVYSKEIDTLTGPAGLSCKGEYIAYLVRLPSDDPQWKPAQSPGQAYDDGSLSPTYVGRIVVGDYRYAISTSKQYGPDCFETTKSGGYVADPTTSQKFADVVNAFSSDFKGIKAE